MAEVQGLRIKLTCDGGILGGNPGGNCYGSWVVEVNGMPFLSVGRRQLPDASTNNEAEYEALLGGLRDVVGSFSDMVIGHSHLDIVTDSQLMQLQVMGRWKCKAENLKIRLSHVDALLGRFATFRVLWTPREEMVRKVGH